MAALITQETLSDAEITQIERLIAICNAYEHLRMRVLMPMIRERPGGTTNDFLYYAEDGTLIGYLCLSQYGESEKEVVAMVHPEHRRQGIFRSLLEKAREVFVSNGGKYLTIVCERSSQSGQATMKAMRIPLNFSEHEMVLGTFTPKNVFDDRLTFRQATMADQEALVKIFMSDGLAEDTANNMITHRMNEKGNRFYLATLGGFDLGCDEPIGTLRLEDYGIDNEFGLYGFVIRPEYQGRGYGRQMLEETIRIVQAEGTQNLMLDVDTSNERALHLYQSVGFTVRTTYDYYNYEVA